MNNFVNSRYYSNAEYVKLVQICLYKFCLASDAISLVLNWEVSDYKIGIGDVSAE